MNSSSFDERFNFINNLLLEYIFNNFNPTNKTIEKSIAIINYSNGLIRIEILSNKIGIGTRQLERPFNHYLGLTPKMFNRYLMRRR